MIDYYLILGDVSCFGNDCYPLAFGVPAILMILSLILFLMGSRLYKKVPPEGNILVNVAAAVGVSLTLTMLDFFLVKQGSENPSRSRSREVVTIFPCYVMHLFFLKFQYYISRN